MNEDIEVWYKPENKEQLDKVSKETIEKLRAVLERRDKIMNGEIKTEGFDFLVQL